MKIYLAHPIAARKVVRQHELKTEQCTGVELLNPFYDTGRGDIEEIDAGTRGIWEIDPTPVVEGDIKDIEKCHAFAAVLSDGLSIGTIMEIVYAFKAGKRIYIIDLVNKRGHPWVRYHATMIFSSWAEFETFLKSMNRPGSKDGAG